MKHVLVITVASAVALAAAAPAEGAPPHLSCRDANGPTGISRHMIGPLAAIGGVEYWADPAAMESHRQGDGYRSKAPPTVRRGRTVTISIVRRDRGFAEMSVGSYHADAIRFTACKQRRWSAWAGGFELKHLGCVHLTAREHGKRRVYRTVLSFGMGDACG